MRKNIFSKIGLITAISICILCLLIKSFLAVHYKSELDGGEMSLRFKINPLGNNLIFADKDEANFFLRTNPESYSGTIFNPIFNIPFPIYVFFLLLLISICVKKKNPKFKKRWLIISTIVTPILIWITWLFQTDDPSEKIYSADNQYSYYLEEYNYNLITELILGMFHEAQYKVFVYDEITGKLLYSGYAGGKTVLRDYFGFDEEYDQFHITKPDYIKLPRPIDKKAIEQKQKREKAAKDSTRWAQEEKQIRIEFYRLTPINDEEIRYIQPVIKKWTDFYDLDLSHARFIKMDSSCFNCPPDPGKIGIYNREFKPADDSPSRIEMSYSPDKKRYVDIGVICEVTDGKYYDTGLYDDSQEVYLVDRKLKHQNILFYNGISTRVQDVFWKTDNVFITVGIDMLYITLDKYFIYVFDLKKQTKKQYELLFNKNPNVEHGSYSEAYLKDHGIIKGY